LLPGAVDTPSPGSRFLQGQLRPSAQIIRAPGSPVPLGTGIRTQKQSCIRAVLNRKETWKSKSFVLAAPILLNLLHLIMTTEPLSKNTCARKTNFPIILKPEIANTLRANMAVKTKKRKKRHAGFSQKKNGKQSAMEHMLAKRRCLGIIQRRHLPLAKRELFGCAGQTQRRRSPVFSPALQGGRRLFAAGRRFLNPSGKEAKDTHSPLSRAAPAGCIQQQRETTYPAMNGGVCCFGKEFVSGSIPLLRPKGRGLDPSLADIQKACAFYIPCRITRPEFIKITKAPRLCSSAPAIGVTIPAPARNIIITLMEKAKTMF